MSIYDIEFLNKDSKPEKMAKYKGKVILVVNTATGCGFSGQYDGLEDLYKTYNGKGLEILDFPCNQFGKQAPGSIKEITNVCKLKYNTTFDQNAKIDVNGKDAAPLFKYLTSKKGGLFGRRIKWNFTKFLVDRNGKVIRRYSPLVKPAKIEKDIKRLIG